jgi:uncharacterized protein (DUF302 family)
MSYSFSTTLRIPFDEAIAKTKDVLQRNGFGVLTEIDVKQTLKTKLDVEFRPYRILGACNPGMAYKALTAEDKIGLMLPCNVVVQQKEDGSVEVAAVDPVASMQAIQNADLGSIAGEVQTQLRKVIADIGGEAGPA